MNPPKATSDPDAALRWLSWFIAMGADEAVQSVPLDRRRLDGSRRLRGPSQTGRPQKEPVSAIPAGHPLTGPSPVVSGADGPGGPTRESRTPSFAAASSPAVMVPAVRDAVALADAAETLAELRRTLAEFDGLSLRRTATNLVFGMGLAHQPYVMFVGEAPGAEEDRHGLPFVGQSGHLLDKMMEAIGLNRETVYITNILPWRPPGNRSPADSEIAACLPFIKRHIALVAPHLLVFLGGTAAKTMLEKTDGITRLRGRWRTYTPYGRPPIPALATYHPAYLLRNAGQKRAVWRDFLLVKEKLRTISSSTPIPPG